MNNKIGGIHRAQAAREELLDIFMKTESKDYLLKDTDYALRFNITRHTIAAIREQFRIPARTERILTRLKALNTEDMVIADLCELLGVKYQNLYKIITDNKIKVKPDVRPIVRLKEHVKNRRLKMLELIEKSGILKDIEKQLEDIDIIIILPPNYVKEQKNAT